MKKFIVRVYALVEMEVEAENIENVVNDVCDLNNNEFSEVDKKLLQIDDVLEVEEV